MAESMEEYFFVSSLFFLFKFINKEYKNRFTFALNLFKLDHQSSNGFKGESF